MHNTHSVELARQLMLVPVLVGLIGCEQQATEHPCQEENHCVRQDGEVMCEDGYTWEDPNDSDNYNCVATSSNESERADAGSAEDDNSYDFTTAHPWFPCPSELDPNVTEVTAFDQEYQYFGTENRREVEADVNFPETEQWAQVGLWFQLQCPDSGLCDHWDRAGSLQLVLNPSAPVEERQSVELLRHITPYRIAMCQYIDVTPLARLLKGQQTLSSWIDTWVGPGHSNGEGWKVTAKFIFYPGPRAAADEVVNIWGRRSITVGQVAPEENVDSQIEPAVVEIPSNAQQVLAHVTTTGHSFGNTGNCAEFCEMRHDLLVNGQVATSINPWRPDCARNPVSPQYGTWEYPRNGWCPGAVSVGHVFDMTDWVIPGQEAEIDFDILLENGTEYHNLSPVDLLPYTMASLKLYIYTSDD